MQKDELKQKDGQQCQSQQAGKFHFAKMNDAPVQRSECGREPLAAFTPAPSTITDAEGRLVKTCERFRGGPYHYRKIKSVSEKNCRLFICPVL